MIRDIWGAMSKRGFRFAMWCALALFVLYVLDSLWKAVLIAREGFRAATVGVPWWLTGGALAMRFLFMGFLFYGYLRLKRAAAHTD
jgi:hypothetical protein